MGNNQASKLMRGCYGYQDPTCYQAMKGLENNDDSREEKNKMLQDIANSNRARNMRLEVDRKHKEYTITLYDKHGQKTYICKTYEDESEIPHVVLTSSGKHIRLKTGNNKKQKETENE